MPASPATPPPLEPPPLVVGQTREPIFPITPEKLARWGRWLARWERSWVLLALLVHVALALQGWRQTSATLEEPVTLTAGVAAWRQGDWGALPAAGAVAPAWGALALGLRGEPPLPNLPSDTPTTRQQRAEAFLYGPGQAATLLPAARALMLGFTLALGLLLYWLARRLAGRPGATVCLLLWTMSPTLLGFGPLLTSDLAGALALMLALAGLLAYHGRPTWPRLALSLLAALAWLTCVLPAWLPENTTRLALSGPMPHPATLLLLKSTPAELLLGVLALLAAWRQRAAGIRGWPILAGGLLAYALGLALAGAPTGHRHLVPLYPLLYLMIGLACANWAGQSRAWRLTVLLLLAWHAGESLSQVHQPLGYRSGLARLCHWGEDRLLASAGDWGQDLPALQRAQAADSPLVEWSLVLVTHASPAWHGLHGRPLPEFGTATDWRPLTDLREGRYAISRNALAGLHNPVLPGPWAPEAESEFQDLQALAEPIILAGDDPALRRTLAERLAEPELDTLLERYQWLRLGRLLAILRQQHPDFRVGTGILGYNLGDNTFERLYHGPAPLGH